MAKRISAKKGGLSVTDGYLDITGARFVKYYAEVPATETTPASTQLVTRWLVQWAFFASEEEAKTPYGMGKPMEIGEIEVAVQKGRDPILQAHNELRAKLAERWVITAESEIA